MEVIARRPRTECIPTSETSEAKPNRAGNPARNHHSKRCGRHQLAAMPSAPSHSRGPRLADGEDTSWESHQARTQVEVVVACARMAESHPNGQPRRRCLAALCARQPVGERGEATSPQSKAGRQQKGPRPACCKLSAQYL